MMMIKHDIKRQCSRIHPFIRSPWGPWGCRWWPGPGRAGSQPGRLCGCCWGPAAPACCFVSVPDPVTLPQCGQNRSTTAGAPSGSSLPEEQKVAVIGNGALNTDRRLVFECVKFVTFSPAPRATAPHIRRWFQLRFRTSIPTFVAVRKRKQT